PTHDASGVAGSDGTYGPNGSPPMITSSIAAVSRTVRDTTPCTPAPCMGSAYAGPAGVRPRPGFSPTSPQQAAGIRIEPPPSLAPAHGTMPAATAAAEPPEEPPGERSSAHGLRAGPHASGSVIPLAPNSGVLVLPKITSPAS